MPLKSGRLTPQELVFTGAMAVTGDSTYAAKQAGYKHPQQNASKLLARPAVNEAILEQQTAILSNEILPLAVTAHRRLLSDPRTPAGALVQAIKLAYDRTIGVASEGYEKEPSEMDAAELAAAIQNLERLKSDRARPVIEVEAVSVFG